MRTRSIAFAGWACGLAVALFAGPTRADEPAVELSVKKIWDSAPHNAFTDLLRHGDRWYCVFREGKGHVSPDGALRVLTSTDGEEWTSAALVTMPETDLRDAKISVTPQGKLMLLGAGVTQPPKQKSHQTYFWLSDDGKNWGEPTAIGDKDYWLWRVTWHDGIAYGVGYPTVSGAIPGSKQIRIYKSTDGKNFEAIVENAATTGFTNEASMLFDKDGSALTLLRRDNYGESKVATALLGDAKAPYEEWTWRDLGVQIGGPQLIRLADGRIVVSGRSYPGGAKTKLWFLDAEKGQLTEFATLPSGGDTSYPGLVQQGDQLWVSYYSSHEGKTSIYLAKVTLPAR